MNETRSGEPPRRAAALAAVLLTLSIASSCRCPGAPPTGATPSPVPPTAAAPPTAAPAGGGLGTLHAWANPLGVAGQFADHTWATSYDAPSTCAPGPEYWYSWGSCHATGASTTARELGRAPADLGVARCICRPDVESYAFVEGDPAHGGIDFYGITGVCHQLSNRILFATAVGGAEPLTVKDAHGYPVSRFVYGTYGSNPSEWDARKTRCLAAAAAAAATAPTPAAAMMRMAAPTMSLDDDLKAMFDERFHADYSRASFEQIRQLRSEFFDQKRQLDRGTIGRRIPRRRYAEQVNELLNAYLARAAGILGERDYRTLFGIPPGERIGLVDPEVAARSEPR